MTKNEIWAIWVLQNEPKLKQMHYQYMIDTKEFIEFNDFALFMHQEGADLIETNSN